MPSLPLQDASSGAESSPTPSGFSSAWDGIAFSNLLTAAIAFALAWISSLALGAPSPAIWSTLAASGTIVVYGVDRLRDVDPDRLTSPKRTRFIERNRRIFQVGVALAAGILGVSLFSAPMPVIILCIAVGAIGLLHRRLKRIAVIKTLYVSMAWTAICVGIPWASLYPKAPRTAALWLAAILFSTFVANLIASNLRDDEAQPAWNTRFRPLILARAAAALGIGLAVLAPAELHPLAWIPLAELAALLLYRPTEHYGHLAVDGALLLGALPSLLKITAAAAG